MKRFVTSFNIIAHLCPTVTPEVNKLLKALAPDVHFENQGCRPLFLVLRNMHVVAKVDGVSPPMIDFYLKQFLPTIQQVTAEAD